ncbi:hypothetical protein V5O48_004528 [Marasmius crinis-equi]|uniref:AB hydrolase-1 domain-containing protein n=1 Tax=Marasmius crinis-equi TaxID=585013 RepID=A0ABR3FPW4_9AGAR
MLNSSLLRAKFSASSRSLFSGRNVLLCRGYATVFDVNSIEPAPLRFDRVSANESSQTAESKSPIVFLHGLLGSKRNWSSLSKSFARISNRPVYAIDLRNHGDSTHKRPHTYEALAADLFHFFETHKLKDVTLIGHSMGGKAAMAMALHPELPKDALSELIVEDIAPSRGPLSSEFRSYLETMQLIQDNRVKTRKEATEMMLKTEKSMEIVSFLLTNLVTPRSGAEDYVTFRVPLDVLTEHFDDLGSFPYSPGEVQWSGRTLFIKGSKSPYINRKNIPIAQEFFPNMKSVNLDTGHWVHAERPREFQDAVFNFLQEGTKHD